MIKLSIINNDFEQAENLKSLLDMHYFIGGVYTSTEMLIDSNAKKTLPFIVIYCNKEIEDIALLKKGFPKSRIIIYNDLENDNLLFYAIQMGVKNFVHHSQKISELLDIIEVVSMGGCYISNSITYKLFAYIQEINDLMLGKKIGQYDLLTKREVSVFELLLSGISYKEIATNLNISIDTTRKHISRIYKKLKIHNKGELYNLYYNVQTQSKQYNLLNIQHSKQK